MVERFSSVIRQTDIGYSCNQKLFLIYGLMKLTLNKGEFINRYQIHFYTRL